MRVLITGATGTIGLALADALRARGDRVLALSRDPERGERVLGAGVEVHPWAEPETTPPPTEALAGADAVVNLLGEPVAQRWSDSAKQRIRESRVRSTRMLVAGLTSVPQDERPRALVSQSATGYYGPRGDAPLDEQRLPGLGLPGRGDAPGRRRRRPPPPRRASSAPGPASSSHRAAGPWPRCCRSSSSVSAVQWPAVSSTCRGSISTTSSARSCALRRPRRCTQGPSTSPPRTPSPTPSSPGRSDTPWGAPRCCRCRARRSNCSTARWPRSSRRVSARSRRNSARWVHVPPPRDRGRA